jgi:diguanylate cyclase (GGDEF)-like protein
MRQLLRVIGAEGLLVVAALVFAAPIAALLESVPYLFPALLGLGVLLAWRFRRSRVVFALLMVALAAAALALQPPLAGDPANGVPPGIPAASPVLLLLGLLIPLDLAVLAWLGERGVFTRLGALRLGVVLAQAAALAAVVFSDSASVVAALSRPLLPARLTAWSTLADPALLAFALSFGLAALRLVLRPDPVTRGLLWSLPALLLALDAGAWGEATTAYLAAVPVILIVSVVESSFAMAYRDGLTGLPSRRAFNEEIMKVGGRYTIAMVDIDHFKRCNDRHGHDVGDQVLRMVAARLSEVSGGGKAFRYGGEEFAILFPGKERAECIHHLERLREGVKGTAFAIRGSDRPRRKPKTPRAARPPARTIAVTVSIGVAERSARHPEPEAVIKAADQALYRAKKEGRNRVVAGGS